MTWTSIWRGKWFGQTSRYRANCRRFLQALKAGCSPEEYRELARSIAAAVDGVGTALTRKAIAAHPELAAEIDASIKEHGRYR